MLLASLLMLLAFSPPRQPALATLTPSELLSTAHTLAVDEGWPVDQPGYSLDPMQPAQDEEFYSIGLYRNHHMLRMYSIDRRTGDIVDFMRGCDVLQFDNVKPVQDRIRAASGGSALPLERLAATVGCPRLRIVNTRWVK